jgi:hypothetical protein
MRIPSKAFLITAAAVAVVAASSCIEHRYEQLSEEEKRLYDGTQSGFQRLSEFFAVRIKNDALHNSVAIYHYADGKEEKERIGTCHIYSFDFANYGPINTCFMLSKDGRALLYRHDGGLKKSDGLYRFRQGEGDRLLVANGAVRGADREKRALEFCPTGDIGIHATCNDISVDDNP